MAGASFVFLWLYILSPLSVTDTNYSVYLICGVFAILCMTKHYYRPQVINSRERKWICAFSMVFSVAVAAANYQLYETMGTLTKVASYGVMFLGGIAVAFPILRFLLIYTPEKKLNNQRVGSRYVFWIVFGVILGINLLFLLFAKYPGILTIDSNVTMQQLLGQTSYNNIMPFWHTITVKIFVELGRLIFGDMNSAVALFHCGQILFMAACFAYAAMTLYDSGVPVWVWVVVTVLYAVLPYNIYYSVTMWKDVPFAGAVLLFVTALYRLLQEVGRHNLWTLCVGGLGVCLWRTNGWYAFLVTFLVMVICLKKNYKNITCAMVGVLIVSWVLLNPFLWYLGADEMKLTETLSVPFQQIARVVANDRVLTEEEQKWLSEIFYLDLIPQRYNPLIADPIKFDTFRQDRAEYLFEHWKNYLCLYLRLGLRYPGDYLKAWIDQTKGYWNAGYTYWVYTQGVYENTYGVSARYGTNLISRLFDTYVMYWEKFKIFTLLTSIGVQIWILISCTLVNVLKKRKEFLLGIPMLVLVAGLWLGTPIYAEFRYAYPFFLTVPFLAVVTFYQRNTRNYPLEQTTVKKGQA